MLEHLDRSDGLGRHCGGLGHEAAEARPLRPSSSDVGAAMTSPAAHEAYRRRPSSGSIRAHASTISPVMDIRVTAAWMQTRGDIGAQG